MVEWEEDNGWKAAKNRSDDFKKHAVNWQAKQIKKEVTGSRSHYMERGNKKHISFYTAIAGVNKKVSSLQSRFNEINELKEEINELQKIVSVDEGLKDFIADMNPNQLRIYEALREIKNNPESEKTQRDIAEDVGVDPGYVTRQKQKFESYGLLGNDQPEEVKEKIAELDTD